MINRHLQEHEKEVARETNLPIEVVAQAYKLYWEFNKTVIKDIPINSLKSEEELSQYRTSINLPALGKLYTDWDKILNQRKRAKFLSKYRNQNINKETNGPESNN